MIVGVLLIGTVFGAVFGLASLILGSSIWMAFFIYSGVGALSALVGAIALALRPETESGTKVATPHGFYPAQRG